MELGVLGWFTDYSIGVVELAREVEAAGFESLWVPEHSHIPVATRSQYPAGEMGPPHSHHLDQRVVAYGDGWLGMPGRREYTDEELARVGELHRLSAEA